MSQSTLVDHMGMPFQKAPPPPRKITKWKKKPWLKEWFRQKDYEDYGDLALRYFMTFVLCPMIAVLVIQFFYLVYRAIIGDPVMGDPGGFVAPIIIMF